MKTAPFSTALFVSIISLSAFQGVVIFARKNLSSIETPLLQKRLTRPGPYSSFDNHKICASYLW